MICPCGGLTKTNVYQIKTMKRARKWLKPIKRKDLPLKVEQLVCESCGRQLVRIVNNQSIRVFSH